MVHFSSHFIMYFDIQCNISYKSELKEDSLSMTAHLEAVHLDNCGEDDFFDENLLFQKPLPMKKIFKEPIEIELKPGKSWRRSISQARKTIQGTNFPSIKERSRSSRSSFIIIPSTFEKIPLTTLM